MATVTIQGWRKGLRKVSLTEAFREHCGLDLASAKSATDRVLDGQMVQVQTVSFSVAQQLVGDLIKLGVDVMCEEK